MSTTIVIPESFCIGYIIGSGGQTIRSIEERTKTKIRWPYKSNPADRKFTPKQTGQPAMSSVPSEVLRDVLLPLSRWTLDDVQFTNRRFLRLITERMSDVCLRQVRHACLRGSTTDPYLAIYANGRPEVRNIPQPHQTTAFLFSLLMQVLRSSRVKKLVIVGYPLTYYTTSTVRSYNTQAPARNWFDLTPQLVTLVLQAPIVVHDLRLHEVGCAELTPTQFQEVILHFSPTLVDVRACRLRACQLTDEFIRTLSKNSARVTMLNEAPVEGGSFHVTDAVVVDFFSQQDFGIGNEGDVLSNWKPYEELILNRGNFAKGLFKRLVEASTTSKRTQMIRIEVSPIPQMDDEDLQDFEQHLSYRKHFGWGDMRVYDFPDEQSDVHLQIQLKHWNPDQDWERGDALEIVRARRPNRFFDEP